MVVITRNMKKRHRTRSVKKWTQFYLFLKQGNKDGDEETENEKDVDYEDEEEEDVDYEETENEEDVDYEDEEEEDVYYEDEENEEEEDDDYEDEENEEEDDEDEENEEEEEEDEDVDENDIKNQILLCLNMANTRKRKNDDTNAFLGKNKIFNKESYKKILSDIELQYYNSLEENHQKRIVDTYNSIKFNNNAISHVPLNFKILNSNMDTRTKQIALMNYEKLNCMLPESSEYFKLQKWLNGLCNIPFGMYKELPVNYTSDKNTIKTFLEYTIDNLDKRVYGHKEAKHQIIRTIGKWISNPFAEGNVIGIHGKPGVGKTTLIKDGLAKCLNLPFAFIPLGGATDSSYLDGHSYTYEGSIWGKIVDVLMKSECMNPILYFDELDKISNTYKGDEIINLLIHLTDPVQNTHFNDKYFLDTPLDLSKALIIFTYNNSELVNPILKDRLITIHTREYTLNDKIHIATNHLIPNILESFNIKKDNITISNENLSYLIKNTKTESGVRNLRRSLELIISNINLNNLLEQNMKEYPIDITQDIIDLYVKKEHVNTTHMFMYL